MRFSDFVLLLNALWFGGAFIQFSIAQGNTLKILVPREERGNPIAPTLSASVAFLGAINLPIGLLSLYLLAFRPPFSSVRRAACVIPVLCRVSLQPVRLQPSGPDAWRTGRGGVLARVEGPDASDFCHRCDAVRGESCCRPPARVPVLTSAIPWADGRSARLQHRTQHRRQIVPAVGLVQDPHLAAAAVDRVDGMFGIA
jgi:hypothetical protein